MPMTEPLGLLREEIVRILAVGNTASLDAIRDWCML
jgi:hypothetical protein